MIIAAFMARSLAFIIQRGAMRDLSPLSIYNPSINPHSVTWSINALISQSSLYFEVESVGDSAVALKRGYRLVGCRLF